MFGPIMRLKVGQLSIEMAPISRDDMPEFVNPGMQQAGVTRYLGRRTGALVVEDEYEWFDRVRKDETRIVWGMYVVDGQDRLIIGNTALFDITIGHIHQATSGSIIFRKEFWGRGIASHTHKARTWFAFQQLGLHRIKSAVIQGNAGSSKALGRSGYTRVYTERNDTFIDGCLHHMDNFECLNPLESFWNQWWHGEAPPKRSLVARQQTQRVLDWADANVTLL